MSAIGIGDKVRVVSGEYVEKCRGLVGICVKLAATGYATIDFGAGFEGWCHRGSLETLWNVHKDEIELVEKHVIGVGDRVRLTEVNDTPDWGDVGDVGTVIVFPLGDHRRVHFDRLNKTFYVPRHRLEVVEIAPTAPVPARQAKPETKFKAGDKVRCIETYSSFFSDSPSSFTEGSVYEVNRYDSETDRIGVVADNQGVDNGWQADKFELATIRVGDKVKYVGDNWKSFVGKVLEDDKSCVPYKVRCDDGRVFWCESVNAELLTTGPVAQQPAPATPAPPTTVLVGQKLRVGPDGAPYIDKGAIIEVLDIKVVYKDRDGDEVSSSISNFVALSDEELAGMAADAKREETLKRLRGLLAPPSAEFAIGAAVTISDGSLDNKTGVILYGPDSDGDYLVGTISNDNRPEEFYYDSRDLKAA